MIHQSYTLHSAHRSTYPLLSITRPLMSTAVLLASPSPYAMQITSVFRVGWERSGLLCSAPLSWEIRHPLTTLPPPPVGDTVGQADLQWC